jgi:NADH-quinone oxidoreductase subunit J
MEVFFWLCAILVIGGGILVITFKNPLFSALSLLLVILALAGIYVLLEAHLLAALQIIIYAGAVVVLFIYVIMLIDLEKPEIGIVRYNFTRYIAAFLIFYLFFRLSQILSYLDLNLISKQGLGEVQSVGKELFTKYLFPFEAVSILLLCAIIGAMTIARRR